jgi:ABC-type Fe3+ transport system substrate-binding protein
VFTAAVCKASKYKSQAQLFIDFLFSDEAKEVYKIGDFEVLEKPAN